MIRSQLPRVLLCSFAVAASTAAQSSEKDVLVFANGEKLIGQLVRANGGKLTFKSDSAGEITVAWSRVLELRTAQPFAALARDMKLGRHEGASKIPQGKVTVADQVITLDPGPGGEQSTLPVKDSAYLIDETTFRRAVREPGVLEGWRGTITAGASLVEATQQGRTFTASIHFERPVPEETWLDARHRTIFDFNGAYGEVRQSGRPTLKNELFHLGLEHDEYFSQQFFLFATSAFDHNFSQGLDLQQTYGGGIGWSAVKSQAAALDVKASLSYLNQQFQAPQPNQNLFGSTFAQTLKRKLWNRITLSQQISVTPTWNNRNAWAAQGSAAFTVPVYKRVSFTVGTLDSFLNNPTPGFRKNSFQFTTGLSYTMQ